ncbi:HNH endonuclease signature motif containing protein [Actinomycetospora sp. TBRC 11914]|uniref:HNH endonuclease signature motif containing protein n=1 Tax=Actinomycetospora sp. TBRC 11914 TaxID=2729387 RepID=UPI00145DDA7F|nr:HNH endonuclease signature motif containing protein [Actinomycetospora sp. TBRC 11914]NMO88278.1 DUF222 domain-containing protein [Actinomycetospora sp. TBRC 11914]
MSTSDADEAVIARARDAMTAARLAEHALLTTIGELAETAAWTSTGHRDLGRFLEELWRLDHAHARHLLRHAEQALPLVALSGQDLPPRLPASAAAAADGAIGEEHLRVLVRAMDRIIALEDIEPAQVTAAEDLLASSARQLSPHGLERVAARLLATLDPDGAAPAEPDEPDDEWLLVHRRDGTLAFTGHIHGAADVELLLETLDALAGPAGPDDTRPLGARRAEALLDLCAAAHTPTGLIDPQDTEDPQPRPDDVASEGEDPDGEDSDGEDSDLERRHSRLHLVPDEPDPHEPDPHKSDPHEFDPGPGARSEPDPGVGGPDDSPPAPPSTPSRARPGAHRAGRLPIPARAQVAVTIPLEWLRAQIGHAEFDTGRPLDPAAARRLACDAQILPAVLGTRSEPVELGRATYAVTEALRRLLTIRDRGCAHPGCTRRPRRCHAHHIRHWIDGGDTDPDNLVLLCRYHHHLVHHGGWDIRMIGGRPWFTPPRWIDPARRPVPGGGSPPGTVAA